MKEGKSFDITQKQVLEAYKRVKANQGAAGIDGITFDEFEKDVKNNLYKIWNRMVSGSYFPMVSRGVEIPKKNGKMRLLGIPTISDRIAQMVVRMSFEPLVEPIFCDNSYGYRPNRSALDAVGITRKRCWEMAWVLEFDIKGLFDNIDHELMMKAVRKHTECKWHLLYIERFLKASMKMPDGTIVGRRAGTPQGGVISPVLSNLFLHYVFDRWMEKEFPALPWVRYADDGIVHARTKTEAESVLERLTERMKACKLEIHPDKTKIVYCKGNIRKLENENESFDFLGYTFRKRLSRNKEGKFFTAFSPAVSKASAKKFRDKIREIRLAKKAVNLGYVASVMNPVIQGWANYFTKFCASEARKTLDSVNIALVRWVKRNMKSTNRGYGKAFKWLARVAKNNPRLFAHWKMGIRPTIG